MLSNFNSLTFNQAAYLIAESNISVQAMQGLPCFIWFCLLSVTLIGGIEMPRFKYNQNNKIVIFDSETWEVGAPNTMAILLPTSKLHITIALAGGDTNDSYRHVMMVFKCNQSSASYSSMDLTSADNSVKQCTKEIPFSVKTKPKEGNYEFFLETSTLNWYESLETKLELRICILISRGNLCSNSLFVWNFYASTDSVEFLTNEAIEFLHRMDVSSDATTETLGQINFIEPRISKSIKSAPAFLRSKIFLGSVLSPGDCTNIQFARSYAIVNYYEQLQEQNQKMLKELQKHTTLTPVFNLRYPSGSEMAGLRLEKERYGFSDVDHRDCRFDPNCFYSTDFDINSTLQSIMMSTSSKGSEMSDRPRTTRTTSDNKANSAVSCKTSWMWPINLSIVVALLI